MQGPFTARKLLGWLKAGHLKPSRMARPHLSAISAADAEAMGDDAPPPPPPRASAPVEKLRFLTASRHKPLLAACADGYLCVWGTAAGTLQMQVRSALHG